MLEVVERPDEPDAILGKSVGERRAQGGPDHVRCNSPVLDTSVDRNEKSSGLFSRMALYWDWFQYNWNEWVVSYDFGHQLSLAQNVQRNSQAWIARLKTYYQEKRRQALAYLLALDRRAEHSRYSLPVILALLLAVLVALRGRAIGGYLQARWSLRVHRKGTLPPELAALQYREMLKLLEHRGWRKSPAQTPLEFAAAIPEGQHSPHVVQLTELYQSARFGAHPAKASEMSSLLARMKEMLRRK